MRRIIQVGLGAMGQRWADVVAASSQWEAAAYVDMDERRLMDTAQKHGMPLDRCFQDLNAAIKSVEAEALLDVTPPAERKQVCLEAFSNELAVLAEKPLADTLANARTLVLRAHKAGVPFMIAQNYRFQAVMQTARRQIERGRLGDLGYVGIGFHKGPRFGGFREEMPYPLLLDMSIHHIDLLRMLIGQDVAAVQGLSVNSPWNWNMGDATLMAQFELSGGVAANYCGSWVSTGWETTWNADWRIEGSRGVLLIEQDELYFSKKPGQRARISPLKWPRTHQEHILSAFAQVLDTGGEPETSGKNNYNSFAATHALVRAVEGRRRVKVSELKL